jgi:2-polyprenyl-3-methyl-5-hydroxy-6-metoxy-1,4-benzoquinol methylase
MIYSDKANMQWEEFWRSNQVKKTASISFSKQRILEILQKYACPGKTALDAGCGSGFFSDYFISNGLNTFSIDLSDQALQMTAKLTQGKGKLFKTDLLNDNLKEVFQGLQFDIIFSDGLFEHFSISDQDKIMSNFLSVLRPSGNVITFVPNKWSPWQLIRPLMMPGIEEKPFVIKELITLNVRQGLRIISKGGINTIPFRWSPDSVLGQQFGMLLYTVSSTCSALMN